MFLVPVAPCGFVIDQPQVTAVWRQLGSARSMRGSRLAVRPEVVTQDQLWTEAAVSGADGQRNGQTAGAGDRIHLELLANSLERSAALGQVDGRRGNVPFS